MDERWQQIEEIFFAARELEPSKRKAFLAKTCGGDESLRLEVEFLLVQADSAGSFLESPAIEMMAENILKDAGMPNPSKPAVEAGTMIAHYRLTGKLGEGGMGEVYRARDTKLQRDVAIKILPESMAHDAQRMARFEREARTLASLNHPNIASIYGLEESNGVRALVMELVEGETLAERISVAAVSPPPVRFTKSKAAGEVRFKPSDSKTGDTGATAGAGLAPARGRPQGLPLQESLAIGKQIAEALEYAHERGVIHRDLKPANVKITPEGAVKVLDFGLAKLMGDTGVQPAGTEEHGHDSRATADSMTEPGMILGTAAYMSPEQAKGQRVDRRCDGWAFGCVLYEMLSGRKAFEGETISDVLAAVLTKDPDWNALPGTTPPSIQRLIRRCLQKDQRQRLQAIGDARITIEEEMSGTGVPPVESRGQDAHATNGDHRSPLQRALPWALAGLLAAALIEGLAVWKFAASASRNFPVLAYIPPPPNTTFRDFGFGAGPVAVSPDGKELAFSATDQKGITQLWVRPLGTSTAQAIAGTEDAAMPFWSATGRSLGFFADQKLKTVNIDNGNVEVLADASCQGTGGTWSSTGIILFTPRCDGPLDQISSSGGKPSPVTRLESDETNHGAPAFLPDGRHFLFASSSSTNASPSIWMGALDSREQKRVLKEASSPQFASGHLFFIRDNRVFAQAFDPGTGDPSGEAVAVAKAQSYSVSAGGVLAYQGGSLLGQSQWFDRSGNPLGSIGPVAMYFAAKISPDGAHILADIYDSESNSSDLWSFPVAREVGTRLTFGPGLKTFAVWSPDGRYIAYACHHGGNAGICRKPADGSGAEETLLTFGSDISRVNVVDWSPDGRYISFDKFPARAPGTEDWILPLFGDRKPFRAADVSAAQYDGHFSPDGRWLAYFSYEAGRPEVYVVPFPGPGGKFQISQNGGWLVRWDKKGRLYFLTMGNRLMEADLTMSGASLQVRALHPIFQLSLPSFAAPFFDVTGDGSRFLVITSADSNASRSVGLLLDWQTKLKGK